MAGSMMATLLMDRETTQTRYCSCSSTTVPKSSSEVNCMYWPREIPVLASWHIRCLRKHLARFLLFTASPVLHQHPPSSCIRSRNRLHVQLFHDPMLTRRSPRYRLPARGWIERTRMGVQVREPALSTLAASGQRPGRIELDLIVPPSSVCRRHRHLKKLFLFFASHRQFLGPAVASLLNLPVFSQVVGY
jgi:hypothetical protein